MSKFLALAAGAVTSAAILYQFKYEIESNTDQIRKNLYNSQYKLEASLPSHLRDEKPKLPSTQLDDRPKLPLPSVSKTEHYVSNRFIPSFKSAWNENVTGIAQYLINFDINETTKSGYNNAKTFVEENLVNNKK
ncbi:hypothetical protein RhiirA5_357190 [Rhizophagus irregularis]|uniref:Uncharacterized protein n=3 Tax=Rhizophagus irregularis TaxID=588596 RepID=A0A2I1DRY5_9GLOM|nr:hypothetical protein GLOIN_2v1655455 [Rhizophagus irregularis DAOM 181602=DAOM 197198]EXX52882.1 hypothetical protein RirG_249140 [Rhizophagus irregularis DAOM 197198w]PKC09010.1 hypothetical protein RhiirA5_357190 [Rhizophagus irregularis]PKC66612.1 hypothetical protein RhiirA1_419156 [Rhizophagus irregularis]PKK79295.1 hypothetical protein RhiirC2_727730 [Rhizophagus irregularis]PKY12605.1 hypothetical protein RhiirB3_397651 [Rhizophagus irregularis]|eukprot:XP_025173532.1 hypothetical protein GLOIN_2v1655455 [Rhizophagus irregularis DAOM 181602=DAOM 197198]